MEEKIISEKMVGNKLYRLIEFTDYEKITIWTIAEVIKYKNSEYEDIIPEKEFSSLDGNLIESAELRFYEFLQELEN